MRLSTFPTTLGLVVLIGLGAFVWMSPSKELFAFHTDFLAARPWTALTYPFVGDLIGALVGGYCLWSIGRSVEIDVGSGRYALFLVVCSILGALGIQLGAILLGVDGNIYGSWTLVGCSILAWSIRYPKMPVRFMFLATFEAKWLGAIAAVLTLVGTRPFELGPFAMLPLLFAWAFAAGRVPHFAYGRPLSDYRRSPKTGRGQRVRSDYFDQVKQREIEREERERLRKLFESSMHDGNDDR